MPYYNPDESSLSLRMRDRLRDLLEADETVRAVYPGLPIRRFWTDNVPQREASRVSLAVAHRQVKTAASATYEALPRFTLMVQQYSGEGQDVVQEDALDNCVRITEAIVLTLLGRYRSDPTDYQTRRLWDDITFDQRTTNYGKQPTFWYSDTVFELYDYERTS